MSRRPDRATSSQAIADIRDCAKAGCQVLGVEGFVVVPDGFVAALDLVLDLSAAKLTVQQAATEAEAFVVSKARSDVLWEVWTELS